MPTTQTSPRPFIGPLPDGFPAAQPVPADWGYGDDTVAPAINVDSLWDQPLFAAQLDIFARHELAYLGRMLLDAISGPYAHFYDDHGDELDQITRAIAWLGAAAAHGEGWDALNTPNEDMANNEFLTIFCPAFQPDAD